MKHLFVALVLSLLGCSSYGRIGETKEECEKRYGQSIKQVSDDSWMFLKSGILIVVYFHEGIADCVVYRKEKEDIIGNPEELSANEQKILRESNSDSDWKKSSAISMSEEWQTEDGKLIATYHPLQHYLAVGTKEWLKRKTKATEQKEKEKLDGF